MRRDSIQRIKNHLKHAQEHKVQKNYTQKKERII